MFFGNISTISLFTLLLDGILLGLPTWSLADDHPRPGRVHVGGDDLYSEKCCLNLVLSMKLQVWSCQNPSPLRANACRMHDQGIKLGGVIPKFGFGACLLLMQQLWVFAWKCSQYGWCSPDLIWLFFLDVWVLCPNLSAELCSAELRCVMNLKQVSSCQEMARRWSAPVCPGGGRRDRQTE